MVHRARLAPARPPARLARTLKSSFTSVSMCIAGCSCAPDTLSHLSRLQRALKEDLLSSEPFVSSA